MVSGSQRVPRAQGGAGGRAEQGLKGGKIREPELAGDKVPLARGIRVDLGPGKSPLVRDISGMRQLWGSCRARGRAAPSRGCPGGEKVPVAATTPAVPQTPRDPRKAWLGLDPLPGNPGAAQSTGKSLLAHLLFLECCEARNPIALKGKKGSGKCLEPCCTSCCPAGHSTGLPEPGKGTAGIVQGSTGAQHLP